MIVNRRDVETALDKLGHHRLDLGFEQDEITHHHGLIARAHPFERDPAAKCKRRLNARAIERYAEVASWKAVAMHVAGDDRGLSAHRVVDFLPVDFLAPRRRCRGQGGSNEKHISKSHYFLRIGLVT